MIRREALRGALQNLINMIDHNILVDETMADAAAMVAKDFFDIGETDIANFLREISRQYRIKVLHMSGQQAALKSEYSTSL